MLAESLMKLKKDVRSEYRSFLVDCFEPSVSSLKNDRISSADMDSKSCLPNRCRNLLKVNS